MEDESMIYMNFVKANVQAEEILSIAKSVKSAADNEFAAWQLNTGTFWTGSNSEAYLEKADDVKELMYKAASMLESAAKTISDISTQTKNAELAALRLVQ